MSEQNIYKDHYELQVAHNLAHQSLQNIHNALVGFVAPHGVQLSLQEVLDLVVQKLQKVSGETAPILSKDEQVASEAHDVTPEKQ